MLVEPVCLQVEREVSSWPGVTATRHGGGMIFFHVGRREIGHLHRNRLADLPFPVRIREQLVSSRRADLHYLHPRTGWISYYIRSEADATPVIELFRLNYSRPWLSNSEPVVPTGPSS
ncbi:MAG TPA: luciferase family protein [Terriglobia bacterium]|nr:luciferase family protein [Terriglobia bacterium]